MKKGNAVNVPLLARGLVSLQQAPMESFSAYNVPNQPKYGCRQILRVHFLTFLEIG